MYGGTDCTQTGPPPHEVYNKNLTGWITKRNQELSSGGNTGLNGTPTSLLSPPGEGVKAEGITEEDDSALQNLLGHVCVSCILNEVAVLTMSHKSRKMREQLFLQIPWWPFQKS